MDAVSYDRIVSEIYEAGSVVSTWERALCSLAAEMNLWGVQIVAIDKASGAMMYALEGGPVPSEASINFIRHYQHCDPRISIVLRLAPGEWIHDHEDFDERCIEASLFFQEFFAARGGRHYSGTKLIDDNATVVLLGLVRGADQKSINARDMQSLDRLLAHLSSALKIYHRYRARSQQVAAAHQVLERMAQPILLLDEHRRIHYCSRTAIDVISDASFLKEEGGLLRFRRPAEDKRLSGVLKQMLSPRHLSVEIPRQVIRLSASADHRPMLVVFDRLKPEPTMQGFGIAPLALVTLHALGSSRLIDPFIVAEAFSLTPAESQVTILLTEGLSPEQIAVKRYASMPTVRTQIRAIFEKVGVARQIDLVRLVRDMPGVGVNRTVRVPACHFDG